jgi:hypothetical protein
MTTYDDFMNNDYPASASVDNSDPEGMQGMENDPVFSSAPSPTPSPWSQMTDAQHWGLIGATLKDIGAHLDGRPGDANNLDAFHQRMQQQNQQFGQQVGFGKVPTIANQVAPVTLNPVNVTPPVTKPGDFALRSLAGLYR